MVLHLLPKTLHTNSEFTRKGDGFGDAASAAAGVGGTGYGKASGRGMRIEELKTFRDENEGDNIK